MINWEDKYGSEFKHFLDEVFRCDPHYIVPVTRKSAKLFRSVELGSRILKKIFYRQYFDYMKIPVKGKTIAVVDNTVEEATTLKEYREFFESRGAGEVKTFAFVGHENLGKGKKLPLDRKMEKPRKMLTEAAYREYLLIESNYLITQGFEQDINHLILEINLNVNGADFQEIAQNIYEVLKKEGFTYLVSPFFDDPIRISIDSPRFFLKYSNFHFNNSFFIGINKVRFHMGSNHPMLCVPMVFPRVNLLEMEEFAGLNFPFKIPLKEVASRNGLFAEKLYYCSVSLLLSAELGRTLLHFLRGNSINNYPLNFENISVNTVDFQRYFGNNLGNRIASSIKKFIGKEEFNLNEDSKKVLEKVLDYDKEKKTHGSFSKKEANTIIEHLREEYEKRKRRKEKTKGVHYYLSLPEMKKISGCSYFNLTQMIDSACDLGILVPDIRKTNQWLERVWRTGETKQLAWDRTIRLIPFAIEVMSTKLGDPQHRIGKTLLNKALVNFAWDYPSFERQIHSLEREPGMFGPVSVVNNDSKLEGKMGIQNHKYIGNRYFLKKGETKKKYFYSKEDSLDDFLEFLDNNTVTLTYNDIHAYFSLLTEIYSAFRKKGRGNVDILTSLAICRDFDRFLDQIHYHFRIWNQHFRVFLEDLGMSSKKESLYDLEKCRTSAKQGFKKVRMYEMFEKMVMKIQKKFEKSLEYRMVLHKVLERQPAIRKDTLTLIKRSFRVQRALGALSLAWFFPEECKQKSSQEMITWSNNLLKANKIKISLNSNDPADESRSRFLKLCNQALVGMMNSIPKARICSAKERVEYFYLDSAMSLAEYYARENNWETITILTMDLKDSRKYENQDKIALMHMIGDRVAGRNNLCLVTQDKSNDTAAYATEHVLDAFRSASEIKKLGMRERLEIHMGIAYRIINSKKKLRNKIIEVFGISSDLANYDKDGIKNDHDVFIDKRLIKKIKKEFPNLEAYCDEIIGAELSGIQVYRLLSDKFLKEYPVAKGTYEETLDKWLAPANT
jgi:hypothetical protein